jgi:hypothetical protein
MAEMDAGAALGGTGLFISIAGVIYSAVNHKHIKSRCCGKEYDVSIDIGTTDDGAKAGEAKEPAPAPAPTAKTEIVGKEEPSFVYKSRINRVVPHFNIS